MPMSTLLIATTNPGKLREVGAILGGLRVSLVTLNEFPELPEPVEGADSFEGNARIKALHYAELTGLWTLADDSGLEVDLLDGAPGVRSARYLAEPGATDADRRRYLVNQLSAHPRPWTARFRSAVAVAFPDGRLLTGEGVCEGEIVPEERGTGGFGYDPIFELANGRTMAELGEAEKNRVSHRGRGVRDLLEKHGNAF